MNNNLDLAHEFPEYQDKIHYLKQSNNHFAKLFESYGNICKDIYKAEQRINLLSEQEEETLRRQRMRIKDQLFAILSS